MSSFKELATTFKKDYGNTVGGQGYGYAEIPRQPTGYFPLDLALGGGLPMGKFIEIYGKEGSCKTSLALKTIATAQKLYPEKKNAWFDIEDTFDPKWASYFGVDVDKLYIFKPDYGEAMIDMTEGLLGSPECGIIVIDSIAALVTTRELGQSAEKQDVGGSGLLMSKLVKKAVAGLSRANKAGYHPTFICINQTRTKIGVLYGDPTTTPGGSGKNFAASCRISVYGKDVIESKYHKHLPVRKELSITIKKYKMPVVMTSCKMEMAIIPHKKMQIGDVDEWNMFVSYMQHHDILKKDKTKWVFMEDKVFSSLVELKEHLSKKPKLTNKIKQAIISVEKEKAMFEAERANSVALEEDSDDGEPVPEKKIKKGKR